MPITHRARRATGVTLHYVRRGRTLGRATLFVLENDLHESPFGLLEDVFVDPSMRSRGIGAKLVQAVMREARRRGCYKLIATGRFGRPHVRRLYESLGFRVHGREFRIDFPHR